MPTRAPPGQAARGPGGRPAPPNRFPSRLQDVAGGGALLGVLHQQRGDGVLGLHRRWRRLGTPGWGRVGRRGPALPPSGRGLGCLLWHRNQPHIPAARCGPVIDGPRVVTHFPLPAAPWLRFQGCRVCPLPPRPSPPPTCSLILGQGSDLKSISPLSTFGPGAADDGRPSKKSRQ